jgi:prepilin-type N-terminal cleavage/methylation domain-containing protein
MKTHRSRTASAFTLIELLVVITIITILASLAAAQIIKAIDDTVVAKTRRHTQVMTSPHGGPK